jgi:hypothetical protein
MTIITDVNVSDIVAEIWLRVAILPNKRPTAHSVSRHELKLPDVVAVN